MEELSAEHLLSEQWRARSVARLSRAAPVLYRAAGVQASVLVPLCVQGTLKEEPVLLYTVRARTLRTHAGQVAFPGGKWEHGETPDMAALRETEEEIGVSRSHIQLWTDMPPVQGTVRAVTITPVVGVIEKYNPDMLHLNPDEVESVFTVPLSHFCDPENQGYVELMYNKFRIPVPLFKYNKYPIWGVTAIITHLFLLNFLPENVYHQKMDRKYDISDLMQSKL